MAELPSKLIRFGSYEADLRSGELRKSGVRVKLQGQPFQVLAILLENAGEVVTREDLRQRVWSTDTFVDFDQSLNTAVNKVREALGDSAANPRFVETLAKRGYRFIAPVHTEGETTSGPAVPSAASPPVELPRVHRGLGRTLFALIQVMYLSFYVVSLAKMPAAAGILDRAAGGLGWVLVVVMMLTAVSGIPVRLYLFTAAAFDYRKLGEKFRRLFPFLLPLDLLWALAPFLLADRIGFGLAFAATAALLYLPFSQRTLMRMTYDTSGGH